jgi:hypothetical protein
LTFLILVCSLTACGAGVLAPALPTAHISRATSLPAPLVPITIATLTPSAVPAPTLSPTSAPTAQAATVPLEQYRAWMAEARAQHPYSEPLEVMWALMICESSGDPNLTDGRYNGLFQYDGATWAGDWNPYRDSPILDPRAQIFATAKAWQDGNQHWWGCYRG